MFLFLFLSITSYADSLFLHSSVSLSTSKALWLKGDQKQDYQGEGLLAGGPNQATRNYWQYSFDGYYSPFEDWEFFSGVRIGTVKLSNGPFLGAKENETNSQISEMHLGAGYRIYKKRYHEYYANLKYIHPGKYGRRHPEFLSFNDFSQYLQLSLSSKHYFKKWEVSPLLMYKRKTAGPGNSHAGAELKGLYQLNSRLKFGPGFDYFTTFGGRDVADDDFVAFTLRNDFFPVWNKKEKWLGLSMFAAYLLPESFIVDFYVHRKLWGENTDISTTFSIGIGKGWNF